MCVCTQTPHTCARHEGTGLWESYEHQGGRHPQGDASKFLLCGKIPNSVGRYLILKAGHIFYPANTLHLLTDPQSACWASAPPAQAMGRGQLWVPPPPHPCLPGAPEAAPLLPCSRTTPSPLSSGPPTSSSLNSEGPSTHCSDLTLPSSAWAHPPSPSKHTRNYRRPRTSPQILRTHAQPPCTLHSAVPRPLKPSCPKSWSSRGHHFWVSAETSSPLAWSEDHNAT